MKINDFIDYAYLNQLKHDFPSMDLTPQNLLEQVDVCLQIAIPVGGLVIDDEQWQTESTVLHVKKDVVDGQDYYQVYYPKERVWIYIPVTHQDQLPIYSQVDNQPRQQISNQDTKIAHLTKAVVMQCIVTMQSNILKQEGEF